MNGEYRQKINIELTESEAHCLIDLVLSLDKATQDDPNQDHSAMTSMIVARLIGAYPNLLEDTNIISFLKKHGYWHNSSDSNDRFDGISGGNELIIWDRIALKRIEEHLQTTRSYIKSEIAKLEARGKFIESSYIRCVLNESGRYNSEKQRLSEIWRRIGDDAKYKIIKERKCQLKSELSRVSREINTLVESYSN